MNIKQLCRAITVLMILALNGTYLYAQKQGTSVKFSCVAWEALSVEQVYYRQGDRYIPLKLSPGNRSELYELKGMTMLGIYALEESEESGKAYKLIGKASIPAGLTRMLFFITERKEPDKLPLRVSGIDDSLMTFPRGACRFVNLTIVPLAVTFGGKTSIIKPKDMTIVKSNVKENGALLPFWIQDSKGNKLYENRFFAQQIGRDMIFILPPKRAGGRVNIKLLPQLVARVPEKK